MKEQIVLRFISAFKEDDQMIVLSCNLTGVFRVNMKNGYVETLAVLPQEFFSYNYMKMCKTASKYYFSPCHSDSIVEIDENNWDKQYLHKIDDEQIGIKKIRCNDVYPVGESVYFVPFGGHAIIELNQETDELHYYNQCYEYISNMISVEPTLLYGGSIVERDKIWFVCRQINVVICFDTKKKETDCYVVGEDKSGFKSICYVDNSFWIYTNKGDLIQWDKSNGVKQIIHDLGGDDPENVDIGLHKGKLLLAGQSMYHCVEVDVKSGECEKIDFKRNCNEERTYGFLTTIDNEIFFLPESNEYFYEIDTNNHCVYGRKFTLEGVELEKYRKMRIKNDVERKGIVVEGDNEPLDDFIKIVRGV